MPAKITPTNSAKHFFILNCSAKLERSIRKHIDIALEELDTFFKFTLDNFGIVFVKRREDFDILFGRQTKWELAIINGKVLFIAAPNMIEKISSYKRRDFYPLLKHELSHLYFNSKYELNVVWISEGIAAYLSQGYLYENKGRQLLKKCLNFDDLFDETQVYKNTELFYLQSYFSVKYLIETFGKERFLGFLDALDSEIEKDMSAFKRIFSKSFMNYDAFVSAVLTYLRRT